MWRRGKVARSSWILTSGHSLRSLNVDLDEVDSSLGIREILVQAEGCDRNARSTVPGVIHSVVTRVDGTAVEMGATCAIGTDPKDVAVDP